MRVLAPNAVDKKRRDEQDVLVRKLAFLQDAVRDEEIVLNTARTRNKKEFEKLGIQFLDFCEEINRRKNVLIREVEELESRKVKALEPIDALRADAERLMREGAALGERNETDSKKLLDDQERLRKGQEQFRERTRHLSKWEAALATSQQLINREGEELKGERDAFKVEKDKFSQWMKSKEEELVQKSESLELGIQSVNVQRGINEKQRKENELERVKLNDKAMTIQAAFEELRNKNV